MFVVTTYKKSTWYLYSKMEQIFDFNSLSADTVNMKMNF